MFSHLKHVNYVTLCLHCPIFIESQRYIFVNRPSNSWIKLPDKRHILDFTIVVLIARVIKLYMYVCMCVYVCVCVCMYVCMYVCVLCMCVLCMCVCMCM